MWPSYGEAIVKSISDEGSVPAQGFLNLVLREYKKIQGKFEVKVFPESENALQNILVAVGEHNQHIDIALSKVVSPGEGTEEPHIDYFGIFPSNAGRDSPEPSEEFIAIDR